ncbi:hypothetical protein [Microbulbifer celer]|uniref:Outer membrane protein beta-barrel domain-containing protein n=1 Tax=Microbulbifer celer TaxID=435905 RepID=A0ABW3UCU5_9GAMM|nr:hypothetical protein [Microbulbifer celer]UFN58873.1 hypothetical protein LPW13_07495 [Microbulbifer celer]
MQFKWVPLAIAATVFSAQSQANSNSELGLGVAYDLGAGVTAQYHGTSVFVNSDALAVDMRIQNFHNDRGTLNGYVDLGGFFEGADNHHHDDRAGVRLPVGLNFGLAPNLQVYIQAVPHFAFSDNDRDEGFGVDGALGLRIRF